MLIDKDSWRRVDSSIRDLVKSIVSLFVEEEIYPLVIENKNDVAIWLHHSRYVRVRFTTPYIFNIEYMCESTIVISAKMDRYQDQEYYEAGRAFRGLVKMIDQVVILYRNDVANVITVIIPVDDNEEEI